MSIRAKAGALVATGALVGSLATAALAGVGVLSAGGSMIHYKVVYKTYAVNQGASKLADVRCPAGMVPVGGGAHYGINSFPLTSVDGAYVAESSVDPSHTGWSSMLVVSSSTSISSFTADVTCASW